MLVTFSLQAQEISETTGVVPELSPGIPDSLTVVYPERVRPFSFITETPANIASIAKWSFQKGNLKPVLLFGAGSYLLILLDQHIIDGTGAVFQSIGIDQEEKFSPLVQIGGKSLIKRPGNINSFFYQLGEPAPTFLVAGGFYLYGKIRHDERASRTASEITESFLTSFIMVQALKRIAGRQSPNKATRPGGKWQFFPSWSDYNNDPTNYFSYPSGHMAAMMSLTTVIAENYPEKKWIRPVGYTLTGLTALSQLNNKCHWASDFLLGLGIGYLSGKITHMVREKKSRRGRR